VTTSRRDLVDILVSVALVAAAIAYVVAAFLTSRGNSWWDRPSAAQLRTAPEIVALGHAVPVGGVPPDELQPGRYRHRVELLDGRTGTYETDRLFSRRTCLEVRAREYKGRLIVVGLAEHEAGCPTDELRDLTR
jgi:hypothetical protein